ncbi:MAG: MotA/TolQ/ExbB proton channel family protein [Myxococcota bacterium]
MDLATVIGVVASFGLVVGAILVGGSIMLFVDPASAMIVIGGTIGAGLINFPLGHMVSAAGVAKNALLHTPVDPQERIQLIVEFSQKARREGILSLESELERVDDPFMVQGIQLAVDGQEMSAIDDILNIEIDYLKERHRSGADIFQTLSAFAPALGLIGTLIGLVQMLQNMDDPASIGPAMAVALLTTFYGAILANLIFGPIAGKLRVRSSEEVLIRELTIQGILSLAAGDNPRLVEQKLKAFLAPKLRGSSEE